MRLILLHDNKWYLKVPDVSELQNVEDPGYLKDSSTIRFLKNYFWPDVTTFMFLVSGYTHQEIDSIVDFIKNNNIKKIRIFIEDVFRIYKPPEFGGEWLQTWPLEDPTVEWWIPELDIINNIKSQTESTEYEIYHCEWNLDSITNKYEKYRLNIKYFDIFLHLWVSQTFFSKTDIKYFEFNSEFDYKISCFNHRPDYFRYFMASLLSTEQDVFVTLNNIYTDKNIDENKSLPVERFSLDVRTKLVENIKNLNFEDFRWDGCSTTILTEGKIYLPPDQQDKSLEIISKSCINLVTETRYASPTIYISEKTLKPMIVNRPFIMLSSPGTLRFLKQLGFKTFSDYWDESYDDIEDHTERFETVYRLVKSILEKPKQELADMLKEMHPILKYNKMQVYSHLGHRLFDINSTNS